MGGSPVPVATSRNAWAKRVIESSTRSTRSPFSRKCSATRMAVSGARLRIMALSSDVETTATVLAMQAGPIVSSRNSRTSRPRSPTSTTTTVSKASAPASIASSVDLPTPEPAKMPSRWPKQIGVKMSMTLTPVENAEPTRWRASAEGCAASAASSGSPCGSAGPPSIGRASASMARPRQAGCGITAKGPRLKTLSPTPASPARSNGATSTSSGEICTISPCLTPARLRCSTMSPSLATPEMPRTR